MANSGSSSRQTQSNLDETQRAAVFKNPTGSYNVGTGVYTSPTGEKSSTINIPKGTKIEINAPSSSSSSRRSGGGGSSQPQSTITNQTPTATSSMTMASVKEQSISTGNKLSNQIQTENRIEPLQDYGYVKSYKQPFGRSLKEFGGNIISNAKEFIFASEGRYKDVFAPFGRANGGSVDVQPFVDLKEKKINFNPFLIPTFTFSKESRSERLFNINIKIGKEIDKLRTDLSGQSSAFVLGVYSKAQTEYDVAFKETQELINKGLPLDTGTSFLSNRESLIEQKYKTQIEDYNTNLTESFAGSVASIEKKYKPILGKVTYGTLDVGTGLQYGVPLLLETGVALSSPLGAGLIGLKEFITGAEKGDVAQTLGGTALLVLPQVSLFGKLGKEISVDAGLGKLKNQGFKFGDVRFTGTNDLSVLQGTKTAGGLTQNIDVIGNVYESGPSMFIQPQSKYVSSISGTIDSAWEGGLFKIKPQAYLGIQVGEIGSKGSILPVKGFKEAELFGTIGKGTLITQAESYGVSDINKATLQSLIKSFKSNVKLYDNKVTQEGFTGFSTKVGDDLYISISGKITSIGPDKGYTLTGFDFGGMDLKVAKQGWMVESQLKDFTLTKIIPKSNLGGLGMGIEFKATPSGLSGLSQISKQEHLIGASLINQGLIQESRGGLIPKMVTKSNLGFSGGGFRGLSSLSSLKSNAVYKTTKTNLGLSPGAFNVNSKSLSSSFVTGGLSSLSKTRLGTASGTGLSQPSLSALSQGQLQLTKLDLSTKSVSQSSLKLMPLNVMEFTGFGGGGFGGGFGFPPLALPSFGSGLGYKKPKKSYKKRKTKIRPSLTASLFDIRGALPKSGAWGITPFQIRKMPL